MRHSFDIATSALDGSDRHRLTEEAGVDFAPRWSPDSDHIVFVRYDNFDCRLFYRKGIYTIKADGSDVRRIVSFRSRNWDKGQDVDDYLGGYGSSSPYLAWSPDGQFLAYVVREVEQERRQTYYSGSIKSRSLLQTVKADGSGLRMLLAQEGQAVIGPPGWSSDGRYIRFMKSGDGGWRLYSIGRDDSVLREMADPSTGTEGLPSAHYSGDLSWSLNDSQILFHLAHDGRATPTLYLVNADGSDLRLLGNGFHGTWSTDGSRIAIVVPEGSGAWSCLGALVCTDVALYIMAPDGSNVRVLARRTDDGLLEAIGPGERHSADVASCSAGVVIPDPDMNRGLVRDCEALVEMADRIAVTQLNWDSDTPIAEWEGVTLDDPTQEDSSTNEPLSPLRVRGLSLPKRGLIDPFPLKVAELTGLRSLELFDNELSGRIPPELSQLTELRRLYLYRNNLSSPIPPELGRLVNLRELHLEGYFDSAIPPEVGQMTSLQLLRLRGVVHGPIPSEIGDLTNLRELTLTGRLNGPIPPELGDLTALKTLKLSGSWLNGPIPPELGSMAALETLDLSYNELSGPIPPELGSMAALKALVLRDNELSGLIPPELGNMAALETLDLSYNELSGPIPPELGNLTALEYLFIRPNSNLNGCIPTALRGHTDIDSHLDFCDQ